MNIYLSLENLLGVSFLYILSLNSHIWSCLSHCLIATATALLVIWFQPTPAYQQSFVIAACSIPALQLLSPPECQVFNLYVWESEAEEHLRSYSCIAVTSFFRSQCHCFRDSWYLKIVSKVATPRRGSCLNSSRLEPLLSKGHMMPQVLYEPVRSQLVDNSPLVTVVC